MADQQIPVHKGNSAYIGNGITKIGVKTVEKMLGVAGNYFEKIAQKAHVVNNVEVFVSLDVLKRKSLDE